MGTIVSMKNVLCAGVCRPALATVAWSFAAALAHAADGGPTAVSGVVVQGEAIETAPRVVPLTTPYTVSTITRQDLAELPLSATTTIQTLLNTQPSIIAYTDGPLGSRTNVFFRAFNSGQFAETYDGVELNDLFNGGVTNQASVINNTLLLPSNIDSIEVFHGINNPAVNAYQSLGGTINYLPRRPADSFGGEIGGSYGSFNTKEFHLEVNTGEIFGVKQFFAFSHADSDGWSHNTGTRNTNFYYSASYAPTSNSELNAIFVYNHNDSYTPFNMPLPLLQQNGGYYQWPLDVTYEKDKDTSYMGILEYKIALTPHITFDNKIFGGNNDYRRTSYSNPNDQESASNPFQPYNLENDPSTFAFWLSSPYPAGFYDPAAVFGSVASGTDYHFYGYAAWGVGYSPSVTVTLPHNTITVGGNVTYGLLHSREYWYGAFSMPMTQGYNDAWDEKDRRVLASAYIQDEIRLFDDRLTLTPGVKYVYAHTSDHDGIGFFYPLAGTVTDDEDYVSPTIGVNFKLSDQVAIYGAFGQNIKFPDISAYYGAFQTDINGNPAIAPPKTQPEHVNDYEAGIRYQKDALSMTLNFYREDFTNTFINKFDPNTGLSTVTNGGASQYQGIELQVATDVPDLTPGHLRIYANASINEAVFTSSFNSDYAGSVTAGAKLANVPENLVSLGLNWDYAGWSLDVEGRIIGRQSLDQQNSGLPTQAQIPLYTQLNIGLSKTFPLHGLSLAKSVEFAVRGENLTNEYYLNEAFTDFDVNGNSFIRGVPGAPRSVTGVVKVKF